MAGMSLQARVHEKREELENLKQLRDLSLAVATQMEALEEKLSTLSDGTEGKTLKTQTARDKLHESWADFYCSNRNCDGQLA